jgi:pilus assembly protein CpaC
MISTKMRSNVMFYIQQQKGLWAVLILIAIALCAPVTHGVAATEIQEVPVVSKKFQLVVGKSTILYSGVSVKRVSVGNPEIADFILLSPKDIYITGKKAGTTNLTLWSNGHVAAVYDLEVSYDVSLLKQQLYNIMPEEKELHVIATNDAITLSGRVSSSGSLSKAMALAQSFAPDGKINNLVEVGGVHQVMLEVRIAEIARSTTKRLGVNFNFVDGERFGISMLGGLSSIDSSNSGSAFDLLISPSVNALFRFDSGSVTWTGIIDALKEDGLAKVLAEPTLIALSGQSANFLAGGEFPVPIPQGLGTTAIEYKKFGVSLNFTPTVLGANRINVQVTPQVSELDFSTAVQFSGFVIPGLTTRTATTTIELGDGQSFAIAGLLRENIVESIHKFPLLGDIPILGVLFRSQSFLKNETELIIVVTPRLVKPLDVAKTSLPTDFYIEPSDGEFYLQGLLEGRANEHRGDVRGMLDGDFGHTVPDLEAADKKRQ